MMQAVKLLNQVKNNKESFVKNITRPNFWNIKNSNNMLKFNAVVGNPPYQLTVAQKDTENGQKRVSSIFHLFQILPEINTKLETFYQDY